MSMFVNVDTEALTQAAGELTLLGSNTVASNAVAASATTAIAPPAADDVSVLLSTFFSGHAQQYQLHAAGGAAKHKQLVTSLENAALGFEITEFDNEEEML